MLKGKRILVLGAGRTGTGIAKVLKQIGVEVIVNDGGNIDNLADDIKIFKEYKIPYTLGEHPLSLLENTPHIIIKNPGIPLEIPFLQECSRRNIPIYTDIELIEDFNNAPVVAITGTNGKTTVTSFIGHMFNTANYKAAIGGNIGRSIAESIFGVDLDVIVAEVSSFQLECTKNFKPRISVITNFSPDHLDRHKTFENYINQKKKIFLNQNENDFTVLNYDNKICRDISAETKGQVYWFSTENEVLKGAYISGDDIYWRDGRLEERVCSIRDIRVLGVFNQENILAGIITGKLFKLENTIIEKAIKTFVGVEHRLEFVDEIKGVKYYNDSKATNTDSTIKALDSFAEPVILLLGGYDKGEDFTKLAALLKKKAKKVILFGVTSERIKGYLNTVEYNTYYHAKTFEDAVKLAKQLSEPMDTVLLSPACASWDQFQNFEQRGKVFKELIYK